MVWSESKKERKRLKMQLVGMHLCSCLETVTIVSHKVATSEHDAARVGGAFYVVLHYSSSSISIYKMVIIVRWQQGIGVRQINPWSPTPYQQTHIRRKVIKGGASINDIVLLIIIRVHSHQQLSMRRMDMVAVLTVVVCALAATTAEAVPAPGTASTVVAGMVFCDQCKDGARGLFDYPLYGARVAIECGGGETPVTVRESNTNWFGGFSIRMDGSPDMNRCTARVVQGTGHCGAAAAGAPPRELTLAFRMLGLALYTVPPLLSQPEQAMDFCPSANDSSFSALPHQAQAQAPLPPLIWRRGRPRRMMPPIWRKPPTLPQEQPKPQPSVPVVASPPPPPTPSSPAPVQGTACTYDKWAAPEHRCYWRVVTPNTTVAMAFGPLAAQRYGSELTLREALDGRGDVYRTLLREATAALLNAYFNAPGSAFLYPTTASVIDHMNGALISSAQRVLIEGARFRRANAAGSSSSTRLSCEFTPCAQAQAQAAASPPPMA